MRTDQDDSGTALIVTRRRPLGRRLARALEGEGRAARVASSFEHLDGPADARPALVIVDLALDPSGPEWARLEGYFPESVLWALIEPGVSTGDALIEAVRRGCHDYLTFPIDRDELVRKLREIERWSASGANGVALDPFLSAEIRLELPSDPSIIEEVVRYLASRCRDFRGYGPRTLLHLRILLSETLSNAMLYGSRNDPGRAVELRMRADARHVAVCVTDTGAGFQTGAVPDPTHPEAIDSPRGRGLFLLHRLADEVKYNECGNSVTFVLRSDSDDRGAARPDPEDAIGTRERLIDELQLAQDLQMKLLPDLADFQDIAEIAGRCVPARPVGGDFYQLYRLSEGRIGVMMGDVTSHGFAAALIMALSMSAAGIYAHEAGSAGDLLRAIHRALIHKLQEAEMFLTLFYGVIDPARSTLTYANAGHAHAFLFHGEGDPIRLRATSPPLGVAEYGGYGEETVPWCPGDLLCLFTDGLTHPSLRPTEQALLDAVRGRRKRSASEIVAAMFETRADLPQPPADDRTALVVRL